MSQPSFLRSRLASAVVAATQPDLSLPTSDSGACTACENAICSTSKDKIEYEITLMSEEEYQNRKTEYFKALEATEFADRDSEDVTEAEAARNGLRSLFPTLIITRATPVNEIRAEVERLEATLITTLQAKSQQFTAKDLASFRKAIKPYLQSGTAEIGKPNLWPVVYSIWHVPDPAFQLTSTNRCRIGTKTSAIPQDVTILDIPGTNVSVCSQRLTEFQADNSLGCRRQSCKSSNQVPQEMYRCYHCRQLLQGGPPRPYQNRD